MLLLGTKDDLPNTFRCYLGEKMVFLSRTLETLVDSRGEGVSQHHHGGVNDYFPTSAQGSRDFPLASTTVQFQHHFIVMPIENDLVPLTVVKAVSRQGEVEVPISEIVGHTEEALENL